MLPVSQTDPINVVLSPSLLPGVAPGLDLPAQRSIGRPVLTVCPRFSCLHIPFPVVSSRVRQWPCPAGLPGFCLPPLSGWASHFLEQRPVYGAWKTPHRVWEGVRTSAQSDLVSTWGVWVRGDAHPTCVCLPHSPLVRFGRKNL